MSTIATTTDSRSPTYSGRFGRKEIEMAEHEMPGLVAMRRSTATANP